MKYKLYYVFVTSKFKPYDLLDPSRTSQETIDATITNLKHTLNILKGDNAMHHWDIVLLTNLPELIPYTVKGFEELGIKVENIAEQGISSEAHPTFQPLLNALASPEDPVIELLKAFHKFPESNKELASWFSADIDSVFGKVVDYMKYVVSIGLGAMVPDINEIFCKEPTEENMSTIFWIKGLLITPEKYIDCNPDEHDDDYNDLKTSHAYQKDMLNAGTFCSEVKNKDITAANAHQRTWDNFIPDYDYHEAFRKFISNLPGEAENPDIDN